MRAKSEKKFHYAWINMLLCILVLFTCGTISQTYGIFLSAITAELHKTMAEASGIVTVLNAVMVLFGPVAAKLVAQKNMRRILPAAFAVLAGLLCAIAAVSSIVVMYLLYALCGCCLYFGMYFLCPYIVNRWFRVRVAETISLIITALAVGGMAGNIVLSKMIENSSWRAAYRVEAVFVLAVAAVVAGFLRDDPAAVGVRPYGEGEAEGKNGQTDRLAGEGLTKKTVLCRPEFYFVVLYVGCMQFCVSMQSQIPALAVSIGLSATAGAVAASLNSFGGIPAKLMLGVCNVRLGVVRSVILYNAVGILGILAVMGLHNRAGLFLFSAVFGFTIGSTTVQLPLLSNRLFGASDEYSQIHAGIVMLSGLIATPGATLAGFIYDRTGGYTVMLSLLAVLLLAGTVFAALAWKKTGQSV